MDAIMSHCKRVSSIGGELRRHNRPADKMLSFSDIRSHRIIISNQAAEMRRNFGLRGRVNRRVQKSGRDFFRPQALDLSDLDVPGGVLAAFPN